MLHFAGSGQVIRSGISNILLHPGGLGITLPVSMSEDLHTALEARPKMQLKLEPSGTLLNRPLSARRLCHH